MQDEALVLDMGEYENTSRGVSSIGAAPGGAGIGPMQISTSPGGGKGKDKVSGSMRDGLCWLHITPRGPHLWAHPPRHVPTGLQM